jgi:hypothetical protein
MLRNRRRQWPVSPAPRLAHRRRRNGHLGVGILERISTGLYVLEVGDERLTRRFLDTAEMLA